MAGLLLTLRAGRGMPGATATIDVPPVTILVELEWNARRCARDTLAAAV